MTPVADVAGVADEGSASGLRRLGGVTATLLVVANMVGTGVFTTTGFLIRDIQSPAAVLATWLIGGLLALCGALAYGELAAALPRNGGEYQLLSRIYHPLVGFLAGWISFVVGFSAPIAASALAFGKYIAALFPTVSPLAAAVTLVLVLSVLHAVHVSAGSSVQNVFAAAKALLILVFVVGGLGRGNFAHLAAPHAPPLGQAILSPACAVGLIFVYFAYSGWNGAAYLAGEIRRPARVLPCSLLVGTCLVLLLYVGLNVVFLCAAPPRELYGVVEIGHLAAARLFGARAGSLLSGLIALALVSSVSAMIMTGPRVYHAMGESCPRLALLSYRGRHGGPVVAIVLQAAAALLMVLTATFELLLGTIGFTLSLSAGATVLGVMVLRRREPALTRPYRTWGYPLTPLFFVGLSCWMVIHSLVERPAIAMAGIATLLSGAALYGLVGRRR